jgi:hypothetical protein
MYALKPTLLSVLSAMTWKIPSKSYFIVCGILFNTIYKLFLSLLSCLSCKVKFYPNPTVLSVVLCIIPSKSYYIGWCYILNPIQILLHWLQWYAESNSNPPVYSSQYVESNPNPTVLSVIICRYPSKSY